MQDTRDFLLLAYKAFGGRIQGKTSLQKKIYFLGVLVGADLGYGPHYYGPYSPELASANTELISLGYVRETVLGVGEIGDRGFEIARHDFDLTDAGRLIAEKKGETYPKDSVRIFEAASKIREAGGDLDYMELSVAAKAYFILAQQGDKASLRDVERIASSDFGWSVRESDLKKAKAFLKEIELVN